MDSFRKNVPQTHRVVFHCQNYASYEFLKELGRLRTKRRYKTILSKILEDKYSWMSGGYANYRIVDVKWNRMDIIFAVGLPPDWLKTFWAKGYPEILDDDLITCAYMDKKSKLLHSTSCEQKHHFLCLKNI